MTIIDSLAVALSGRRLLIVLDNCEHVLDAAASVVEAILARTTTVSIITTSREALGVSGEYVWPVAPLEVDTGTASPAVALFVERATAVTPGFSLDEPGTVDAVTEICRRLDGIALAIELAAARMVSMSAPEVRDRLTDRFRLLSGGRRGIQRHQTLRQAVQWSYDLLTPDERAVLECCSVFADGFDLDAVSTVYGSDDVYLMLDHIESLVRKSLILAEHHGGHTTRYRVLETIRQFGEERLAAAGALVDVRDRHARFFSERTMHHWETWDGPGQRAALDWADTEFANLRTAFRWATERADLATATAIAAHAAIMVWPIQRFEPVSWALEILDRAAEADVPHLPRLYVAASLCLYLGQPDLGVAYAQTATALATDVRYDPFENGWSEMLEALAHLFGGRIERRVEISSELATRSGFARVVGLCGLTWALPAAGRAEDAMAIADDALGAAREYGSPFWIGWALGGYGRAFAEREPVRALAALREGLVYARENRLGFWEANLAQDAARLEASHGELDDALGLFTTSIDSFHRAGNIVFLAAALASLAVFFDRFGQAEAAATVYGASTRQASIGLVPNLGDGVAHLRSVLDETRFEELVAVGAALETAEAVRFARQQIERIGRELAPERGAIPTRREQEQRPTPSDCAGT
jgi:predicted ATPase